MCAQQIGYLANIAHVLADEETMMASLDFVEVALILGWNILCFDEVADVALLANLAVQVVCVVLVSPLVVVGSEDVDRHIYGSNRVEVYFGRQFLTVPN